MRNPRIFIQTMITLASASLGLCFGRRRGRGRPQHLPQRAQERPFSDGNDHLDLPMGPHESLCDMRTGQCPELRSQR